jgi:N-acetylmuramoyl-L-alanine amidase
MVKKDKICKSMCLMLATSLMISVYPPMDVLAEDTQKIYSYTSKSVMMVSDAQIDYYFNGLSISLKGTPGILTDNNVALGPYVPIFRDKLGIKTYYSKDKKTITFKSESTTLVLTLGSKTAQLNGNSVEMSAAPISMKYAESGKTAILVPTRFVAEKFGYYYEWNSQTETVNINKAMQLSYDNQNVKYTGIAGRVSVDGKSVNVTNMPTIIMGNTAMIQAYRVFYSRLGVDYKYSPSTKKLTFKKGKITLEMELNSTLAYINGQVVDCGMAPKLVKNQETKAEVVLVPGQFVSKALGYDYSWNSNKKTSEITTTDMVGVKPNIVISSGSSASPIQTNNPIQYFTWNQSASIPSLIQEAKEALSLTKSLETPDAYTSTLSGIQEVVTEQETAVVQLQFATPFTKVTSTQEGTTITLELANTYSNANQISFNNDLLQGAQIVYDSSTMKTYVILSTKQENINYKLVASDDNSSIFLTVYPNYLTDITANRDKNGTSYLTLTGLTALKPVVTEDNDNFYIQLPNTRNGIGELVYSSDGTSDNILDSVILQTPSDNSSFLIVHKPSQEATYSLKQDGVTTTFYIEQEGVIPVFDNIAIQVKLPTGVTQANITDEDRYYKRQILLYLPGDQRKFFEQNPISNTYDSVSSIKVTYNSSNQTVITITTNKIQGYDYTVKDNVLNLMVGQPSEFYDKIVLLDAGHGGYDPGAINGSTKEKNINFNVLNVYAKEAFKDSGIKVYFTRVDDTLIDLYDRADYSMETEADLFISVHCNAASSSAARGTSVYYSTVNKSRGATGLTSKILASSLVNSLSANLGTRNLGTIDRAFVVVRENTVPAVLIELGFLTNPDDKAKLVSTTYQKKAAQTIFNTVVGIFNAYPTKR